MKIRNVAENRFTAATGSLDVEYQSGAQWLPYTATPGDSAAINSAILLEIQRQRETGALEIAEYTMQDVPTDAERLAAWRAQVSCSRFQAKEALRDAGLFEAAEAAIASADGRTQRAWSDETVFRRTSPTIAAIASAMNLSDAQVDDLFRAATAIRV